MTIEAVARIQLVTIVGASVLLLIVLELVRRRHLMERYALLWLLSAVVLLALAIWSDALGKISRAIGVIYAPNALFFVAFGFVLVLLLHFSYVVSRLTAQSNRLAQRQALLEERLRSLEAPGPAATQNGAAPIAPHAQELSHIPPV